MDAAPRRPGAGGGRVRPCAIPLGSGAAPGAAALLLRDQPGAVALSGAWAGGPDILASHPLHVLGADEDPFAALDTLPAPITGLGIFATSDVAFVPSSPDGAPPARPVVGGGWIGWLGFELGQRLEPLTLAPPGDPRLGPFRLAFHDHVVRRDADGAWWFEALWTDARDALLRARLDWWRGRLGGSSPTPAPDPLAPTQAACPPLAQAAGPLLAQAAGPLPPAYTAGPLRPLAAGLPAHRVAVAEAIARIAEGELSQANVCLAFEGPFAGDPLELWIAANQALAPEYAAFVAGGRPGEAVASLSPELFLRRAGEVAESRPIKGTAPRAEDPARLAASEKDRAENVMIVDLVRNDLGRVCAYGSVTVPTLCEVRPAAGVWHLHSTVRGRLRPGTGDGALVRAAFPPGSVTGAPKVRALRVIHELESAPREVYCGAIGIRSPLCGLELNVAIRTFEIAGGRIRLGAGGGIVSDSDPDSEVAEALAKARGVATAAGIAVDAPMPSAPALPALRLPRPDPAGGVLETLRVAAAEPSRLADHLARLRASCATLGLPLDADLEARVRAAADALGDGALRIHVGPRGVEVTARPLPAPGPMRLEPVGLPGGLGAHKWADRALVDALSRPGVTPLLCELDMTVLEAGYAAVLLVSGTTLSAPPLDGRILPSVSRAALLERAPAAGLRVRIASFTLAQARAADAVILCSSLRGPHPGQLPGGSDPTRAAELCARLS